MATYVLTGASRIVGWEAGTMLQIGERVPFPSFVLKLTSDESRSAKSNHTKGSHN